MQSLVESLHRANLATRPKMSLGLPFLNHIPCRVINCALEEASNTGLQNIPIWGKYPKIPGNVGSKSREENENRDKSQLGTPLFLDVLDKEADDDDAMNNTGAESLDLLDCSSVQPLSDCDIRDRK